MSVLVFIYMSFVYILLLYTRTVSACKAGGEGGVGFLCVCELYTRHTRLRKKKTVFAPGGLCIQYYIYNIPACIQCLRSVYIYLLFFII